MAKSLGLGEAASSILVTSASFMALEGWDGLLAPLGSFIRGLLKILPFSTVIPEKISSS